MRYEERGLTRSEPVRYHRSEYLQASSLRMHYHSSLEINICHDVSGVINIEGRTIPLESCRCICLFPNVLHSYQIEGHGGSIEVLHIAMDRLLFINGEELLGRLSHANTSVILEDQGTSEISRLMQEIATASDLKRGSAIFSLVGLLSQKSSKNYQRDGDSFLHKILTYAETHYHGHISLEGAAKELNMSRFHFARKFKQKSGSTFMEYIQNLRLENSLLLLDEGYNVTEAAHASGFEDISYFIKRFRLQFGMTPGKYTANSRL